MPRAKLPAVGELSLDGLCPLKLFTRILLWKSGWPLEVLNGAMKVFFRIYLGLIVFIYLAHGASAQWIK